MPKRDELENYLKVILHEVTMDGCIVISPRQGEFNRFESSFLEGLKNVPAVIDKPPGVDNPFTYALGHPGRWLMLWVPDRSS